MQGFILNVTKVKNEDLIVSILTSQRLYTLYRFYGARHSTINLGYKIDFTIQEQIGYMNRLRNITHLGFSWNKEIAKMLPWQEFMKLLYKHLQDIEVVDNFYFELLEDIAKKIQRQNAKRALIEGYVKLLEHEGRLHQEEFCFLCEEKIGSDVTFARSFLLAHPNCIHKKGFFKAKIEHLFRYKDTQFFEDREIEYIWNTLKEGL